MAGSKPPNANETVNYTAANELVWDAWKASCNAYTSKDFHVNEVRKGVLFIAFGGFQQYTELTTETDFGECEIKVEDQCFPSMNDGDAGDPKPALVRKVFMDRFLFLLQRSSLKNQVLQAQKDKKTVVFTGHSFGGGIATLSTLWALEKHLSKFSVCITFGCPLVADKIFSKAIERENWSPYFCHIVSKHDIVPRICFSSFKSPAISKALDSLLPYWHKAMEANAKAMETQDENKQLVQHDGHPLGKEESVSLMKQVIGDASQVLSYETESFTVGPANLVGGEVKSVIRRSPYRPFGYYIFCSSSGSVCCIKNRKAALQMLYLALETNKLSGACIMEHIEYGKTIKHISGFRGQVTTYSKIAKPDKSSEDTGLVLQLESMGIGIQNAPAWLGLKGAEEDNEKVSKNMREQDAKLDEIQSYVAELEWYKTSCEAADLPGYYDCFKIHTTEKDLKANKCRLKLGAFWNHIIELVEKEELPPHFQTRERWIRAGTEYRLLVEPLDIAHYYRFGKHEEHGHYLVHGRPRRYKLLQKWLEDEKKRKRETEGRTRSQPAFHTQDSCFWAYVEEALCSGQKQQNITKEVRDFEEVMLMAERFELSPDVVADGSTLWKLLPEDEKSNFPLNKLRSHYYGPMNEPALEAAPDASRPMNEPALEAAPDASNRTLQLRNRTIEL